MAESQYLAKMTVLDVGQGTSVVFQDNHRTLLYDTGGGDPQGWNIAEAVLLPYLLHQGVTKLDTFVVSHFDTDHSAGVAAIMAALTPRHSLYGGKLLTQAYPDSDRCRVGQAWRWNREVSFQVVSARDSAVGSSNNASCALLIHVGRQKLLLPGDIDSSQERELVKYWRSDLQSDWLLAGHHGSKTSTSLLWLKYVQPGYAVFSSGFRHAFGHPHSSVVRRLEQQQVEMLSTAENGAVEFYFRHDGTIDVKRYRATEKRYWL